MPVERTSANNGHLVFLTIFPMKIGIDAMGGDHAPLEIVKGAVSSYEFIAKETRLVLFGDEQQIIKICQEHNFDINLFDIVDAPQTIEMHEHPSKTFQIKQNSSIFKGFEHLATKQIDAFASAGNTGAMLVGAMMVIKPVEGIIRPCIATIIPRIDHKKSLLLDVGLNADCKPEMLAQFGMLGAIYIEEIYGVRNPKVALLNIGAEEGKGNTTVQAAYALMKDTNTINFAGNIEGSDIFRENTADVIVTDGFTGNVALKQTEYFYKLLRKRNIDDEYFNQLNFELYGGTPVLGINQPVIIGHGVSKSTAIKNMILHSVEVTKARLPEKIASRIILNNN